MPKFLQTLKGIAKPGNISSIEFVNNPVNYLIASYSSWKSTVDALAGAARINAFYGMDKKAGQIYGQAEKLIVPKLKGINLEDILSLLKEDYNPNRGWSGIYLTLLLNQGILDEVVIQKGCYGLSFVGYKLKRGKIRIHEQVFNYTGENATGGIIENYAKLQTSLGHYSSGGIFVNNGEAYCLGHSVTGGIYINNGIINTSFGSDAKNSVIIHSGAAKGYVLNEASNCLAIYRGKSLSKPMDTFRNITIKNNLLLNRKFLRPFENLESAALAYDEENVLRILTTIREYFCSKDRNIIYFPESIL